MTQRPLVFATFLAPNIRPVYEAISEHVGRLLGCGAKLIDGNSYEQFTDDVDAGFICGYPYVRLAARPSPPVVPLAAPVLRGERYGSRPIYFSDVIVRRESSLCAFEDLRGRSWSYNELDSHSGYLITLFRLLQMGETTGFFDTVREAGWHQRSIRMVASGEVDGSAIDSQVLAVELRDHPGLSEQLRVIDSLGPSTIQPVVAATRLAPGLREEIREVLLAMRDDPALRGAFEAGLMEHFVRIDDPDYDDIRQMLTAVEAACFTALR